MPPPEPVQPQLAQNELSPEIPQHVGSSIARKINSTAQTSVMRIPDDRFGPSAHIDKGRATASLQNIMTAGINSLIENETDQRAMETRAAQWSDAFGLGFQYNDSYDNSLETFMNNNALHAPDQVNAFLVGLQTRVVLLARVGVLVQRFPKFIEALQQERSPVVAALTTLRDEEHSLGRGYDIRWHLVEEELAEQGTFIPGAVEHLFSSMEQNMRTQTALVVGDFLKERTGTIDTNLANQIVEVLERQRLFTRGRTLPPEREARRDLYFRQHSVERAFVHGLRNNLIEIDENGNQVKGSWQKPASLESLPWQRVADNASSHEMTWIENDRNLVLRPEGERAFLAGNLVRSLLRQDFDPSKNFYRPEDIVSRLKNLEGGEALVEDVVAASINAMVEAGNLTPHDQFVRVFDERLSKFTNKRLGEALEEHQQSIAHRKQNEASQVQGVREELGVKNPAPSLALVAPETPVQTEPVLDPVSDFMASVGDPKKLTPEQRASLLRWLESTKE